MDEGNKKKSFLSGIFDRFKGGKEKKEEPVVKTEELLREPEKPEIVIQSEAKTEEQVASAAKETADKLEVRICEAETECKNVEIELDVKAKEIDTEEELTALAGETSEMEDTTDYEYAKLVTEVSDANEPLPEDIEELQAVEEEPEQGVETEVETEKEEKKGVIGWFKKLKAGLDKTRKSFVFKMQGLFRLRNVIDEDFWEELEEILITADVGLETTQYIVDQMRAAVKEHYISQPSHLFDVMKDKLAAIMEEESIALDIDRKGLSVIMVVGVNGTGKTTSIAKIAYMLKKQGKKVLIAAADTFRAAAIEQLEVWGKRLGLDIIKHKENSDPAAVVFDAVSAAQARNADVLIIDTAGRLHSKVNLMKELEKIKRVINKSIPDAPHETLLVLDSTTGQNALIQARTFKESVDLTGIVLTKLDGTAKGGIIIGIVHELGVPVKFIGVGEAVDDLRPFESKNFLDALFAEENEMEAKEEVNA